MKKLLPLILALATTASLSAQIEVVSGGNVGIGTTTPGTKLDVVGRGRFASSTQATPTSGSGIELQFVGNSTEQGRILSYDRTASAYKFLSIEGSTLALNSGSGGNVGIGTASPQSKLHVVAAAGGTTATFTDNTNSSLSIQHPVAGVMRFDINGGNHFAFSQASTERMRITSAGNVGIGTTNPGYKLEVAGSVRATSFISDTYTYADFVFRPDYSLPALSEVEAHIKERGHLPGIPSEAEARKDGVDLAAMQVKLLQKVEELTLHAIAQEKRTQAQEKEIAALREELTALKNR